MAQFKHFSDLNGETVELVRVTTMTNKEFAAAFPGVAGRRSDSFSMMVGEHSGIAPTFDRVAGKWVRHYLPVTRMIEMRARPTRHECDARCLNATGKIMKCECQCGGKNHGRGSVSLVCSAVAA